MVGYPDVIAREEEKQAEYNPKNNGASAGDFIATRINGAIRLRHAKLAVARLLLAVVLLLAVSVGFRGVVVVSFIDASVAGTSGFVEERSLLRAQAHAARSSRSGINRRINAIGLPTVAL